MDESKLIDILEHTYSDPGVSTYNSTLLRVPKDLDIALEKDHWHNWCGNKSFAEYLVELCKAEEVDVEKVVIEGHASS